MGLFITVLYISLPPKLASSKSLQIVLPQLIQEPSSLQLLSYGTAFLYFHAHQVSICVQTLYDYTTFLLCLCYLTLLTLLML